MILTPNSQLMFGTLLVSSSARADEPNRAKIAPAFFEQMFATLAIWAHSTLTLDARQVTLDEDGVHIALRYKPSEASERAIPTRLLVPVTLRVETLAKLPCRATATSCRPCCSWTSIRASSRATSPRKFGIRR